MRFSNTFRIVWWFILVGPLTAVLAYRITAFAEGQATAVDLGLVLIWALLFVAPIYVEVSVAGVSLKQQIETVREEVKADVASVRNEMRTIVGISTQVSPQFTLTAPPPNSDLPALEQRIKAAMAEVLAAHGLQSPATPKAESIHPPSDVAFLFGVRYEIDRQLSRIAEEQALDIPVHKRFGPNLAGELARYGIIDKRLVGAIRDVYRVCSPAIHGQDPSPEQVAFVRDVAPNVLAALRLVVLTPMDHAFDRLHDLPTTKSQLGDKW